MQSVERRCHCHCLRNHLADRSHCFVFLISHSWTWTYQKELEHESSQGLCEERLPFQSFFILHDHDLQTVEWFNTGHLKLPIWAPKIIKHPWGCYFSFKKKSRMHSCDSPTPVSTIGAGSSGTSTTFTLQIGRASKLQLLIHTILR